MALSKRMRFTSPTRTTEYMATLHNTRLSTVGIFFPDAGTHVGVTSDVVPRICCNWPVRGEMTGALGATELGRIGDAAFVSE